MAQLLFTVSGAVVNALAFSGTNFLFNRLTDHGAEERKRHDLAEEKLQRARDKRNEDRMDDLISLTKDYVNKIRQGHILMIPMKQYLNIIEYFQNK